jgi:uncharacterized membrane protein YdfJ with MMPL/SSD domain
MYDVIGSFCVRRRRLIIIGWAVLFVVGIAVGSMVFGRLKDTNGGASTESVQGFNILDKASSTGPTMIVVVDHAAVDSPTTQAAVERLTAKLGQLPNVV